jgi:uncharacterized protein
VDRLSERRAVVLDTNVLVAAGFNPRSHAARIVAAVRADRVRLVWDEATFRETRRILEKIPPLSWAAFSSLFRDEERYEGPVDPSGFEFIPDPEDRKFAALAAAAGATLVSQDDHLLAIRGHAETPRVLTPGELVWEVDR